MSPAWEVEEEKTREARPEDDLAALQRRKEMWRHRKRHQGITEGGAAQQRVDRNMAKELKTRRENRTPPKTQA